MCDADAGLLVVHVADGSIETLLTDIDGVRMRFCNNAAIAADGTVWFSDSSLQYGVHEWKDDFVQHTRTGRLVRRDVDGTVTVVIDDLAFANGVALSSDEQFVAVAETGARTVVRWWIAGARKGERDFLVRDLPGYPDNIARGSDGLIWVTIASPTDPLVERLHKAPLALRKLVTRIPEKLQPQPRRDDPRAGVRRRGDPGPRPRPGGAGLPHGHRRPRARRTGLDGQPARAGGGGLRAAMK